MREINFNYDGKDYRLAYTRESVKIIEAQGFDINTLQSRMATMVPLLFYGAFHVYHKGIKRKLVDEIWEGIKCPEIVEALTSMVVETLSDIIGTEEGEVDAGKKITWEVTK